MSALQTPAPDAPAEEWGQCAVSIPGFQYPSPMPRCLVDDEWGPLPDPGHWAWEGWMLRLLGGGEFSLWATAHFNAREIGIGRACIAYAAANGRWPGGDS